MLTAAAVVLALSACVVAGRWYLARVDGIGRRIDFPTLWVGLLAVLATGAAAPGVLRGQLEDRLSAVASTLAGRQVRVRCQALGGAFVDVGSELGLVHFRPNGTPVSWALIKRDQCNDLAGYLHSSKQQPSSKRTVAVHVLTHESMHLASIRVEAAAECAAVQRDAQTARLLGALPAEAAALAAAYYASWYPRLSDDYRSVQCAAGGALDESGRDAPWIAAAR